MNETDWQRIARYALGECTPEEAVATRAWIDADDERRALADDLIRIADGGPTAIFDVAGAWERFRATMPPAPRDVPSVATRRAPPRRRGRRLLLAASVALAMLASAVVWQRMRAPTAPAVAVEDLRTIGTQARQTSEIYLSDGTRVRLGPSSTIRFAERFGRTRDVWLEGVAYFEVAEERRGLLRRERPFAVRTEHGVVRDIGTSFSVRAWQGSATTEVVVAEGMVALAPPSQDVPAREVADSILLSAGDLGRLDTAGSLTIERGVDVAAYHSWMQNRLTFTDAPIDDVIAQFRQWFGVDVQLGDASFAEAHVTATFDLRSPGEALDLMAAVLDARTVRSGSTVILYRNNRR